MQENECSGSRTWATRRKGRGTTRSNQQGSGAVTESPIVALGEGKPNELSQQDEERAPKIVNRIQKGLEAVSTAPPITPEPDGQCCTYEDYAVCLLSRAETWGKDAQNFVWWTKFFAGSISFASLSLPARPAGLKADNAISKRSRSEIVRWRGIAQFSNTLATGLFPT